VVAPLAAHEALGEDAQLDVRLLEQRFSVFAVVAGGDARRNGVQFGGHRARERDGPARCWRKTAAEFAGPVRARAALAGSMSRWILEDEPDGREIAPGVVIERRRLLALPAAALLAAWTTRQGELASKPASAPSESGRLTFEQFLAEAVPGASARAADTSPRGQDAYLWYLASLAVRILEVPEPKLATFGSVEGVRFGRSFEGPPFLALYWRMEPGAHLPAHPHPTACVCTVGLEGEARMRNFEFMGEPDYETKERFRVRFQHAQILKPGRVNTLSTVRDNLHEFRAGPRGARGIDFTTRVLPGEAKTLYLDLPDEPVEGHPFLFEARWR